VSRLKALLVICLSLCALFWLDQVLIGLVLATFALALSVPLRARPSASEIVVLSWSSLVMLAFNFAHLELWRRLLVALVLRTEAAPLLSSGLAG